MDIWSIVFAVLDLWESVTNRLRYRKSVKHRR